MSLKKSAVVAASTLALTCGLLATTLGTSEAATTQTSQCTDGGRTLWKGKSVWGNEYTDSSGVKRISNDTTGFTSSSSRATTVDYTIKTYDANGSLRQTLREDDRRFDFARGTRYLNRNVADPVSGPGKSKVVVNLGDGNDGYGNCTMTFVQPGASTPTPSPTPTTPSNEKIINTAFVTAYTWFDNTPPGSAAISHPVIHDRAGGVGTYADPVTIAVGHDLSTGKGVLDYPAGTIMYIPDVRRYFIVEDTCGDGPTPEKGACHNPQAGGAPSGSTTWVDMWIGGQGGTNSTLDACARQVTAKETIVINPAKDYVVASGNGVWHDGKCDGDYGNALVKG